jgi:hypothetical protein
MLRRKESDWPCHPVPSHESGSVYSLGRCARRMYNGRKEMIGSKALASLNCSDTLKLMSIFLLFLSKEHKNLSKANPVQVYIEPKGSRRLRLPGFSDTRHMEEARLSVPRTGLLYSPGKIPGTHFCQRLSRPWSHSAAGRNK